MLIGILSALLASAMLGLYALPGKYIKDFQEENKLSDKHPLTSRVVVNRYWQLLFGYGLVRTPEDFGLQGQAPTHPELLDWLARDLMNNHWDVRRLVKQIALSSTYLQNSVVDLKTRNRDPENRLYTRAKPTFVRRNGT